MLGAIAGDIIGSRFEMANFFSKDFELFTRDNTFTDDTICSVAIADCLLNSLSWNFASYLRHYCREVPHAGYGGMFKRWIGDEAKGPYGSWGNGGAMRVSAIPYIASDGWDAMSIAEKTCNVTHNHPDAINGARALVEAMCFAMDKLPVDRIRLAISEDYEYDLSSSVTDLQNMRLEFDVSAKGTVPLALICALESESFEDAIRNAISVGGDSDTIACMAGGLAEILHGGVPEYIKIEVYNRLPYKYIEIIEQLYSVYDNRN